MYRSMTMEDIDAVMALEAKTLHGRWTRKHFEYELNENEFAYLYVCEKDNNIIGFIDFWITFECCQLSAIAVDETYRGLGYAQGLMQIMMKQANQDGCERVMLEVRTSNKTAQQFYQKLDFYEMNRRKNYYNDNGEDAIIMAKALEGEW